MRPQAQTPSDENKPHMSCCRRAEWTRCRVLLVLHEEEFSSMSKMKEYIKDCTWVQKTREAACCVWASDLLQRQTEMTDSLCVWCSNEFGSFARHLTEISVHRTTTSDNKFQSLSQEFYLFVLPISQINPNNTEFAVTAWEAVYTLVRSPCRANKGELQNDLTWCTVYSAMLSQPHCQNSTSFNQQKGLWK